MIPLADARATVFEGCAPLPPRAVALAEAAGCVTATALTSAELVPPFDNTAMDGFAVRSADTAGATESDPVVLDVVATLAAGAAPDRAVGPGEAVRIMTGAPRSWSRCRRGTTSARRATTSALVTPCSDPAPC